MKLIGWSELTKKEVRLQMSNQIIVIDALMGEGKTTYFRQYIKQHPEKRFMFVSTTLKQVETNIEEVAPIEMWQPDYRDRQKLKNLKDIIKIGTNIATTHALFQLMDDECLELIQQQEYILILDEVLDVIDELPYKKKDIQLLEDAGYIKTRENGHLEWIGPPGEFYIKELQDLENMIRGDKVIKIDDYKLIWQFPPQVFSSFGQIYILTYLFESSMLYYYFEYNHISYIKKSMKNHEIVGYYLPNPAKFRDLINIYEGKLNRNFNNKGYSLSKNYCKNHPEDMVQLKNNLYNYFRYHTDSSSNERMWTTYKDFRDKLKNKGYSKGFLACNAKGTNEFRHKTSLAYCVSFYMKPMLLNYFYNIGIEIDQEEHALSTMLQWIWRSQIRDGKPINLYLPSLRMRRLLYEWLGYTPLEISNRTF